MLYIDTNAPGERQNSGCGGEEGMAVDTLEQLRGKVTLCPVALDSSCCQRISDP